MIENIIIDVYCALVVFAVLASFLGLCFSLCGIEYVNPIWLYNRIKVNWFGAVLLAVLFNILTVPYAICYWIYKICTVGRE